MLQRQQKVELHCSIPLRSASSDVHKWSFTILHLLTWCTLHTVKTNRLACVCLVCMTHIYSHSNNLYNTIQYKNDFYSAVIEGAEALVGRLWMVQCSTAVKHILCGTCIKLWSLFANGAICQQTNMRSVKSRTGQLADSTRGLDNSWSGQLSTLTCSIAHS